ncbi:ribokinase [Halalkalibaculum sp. DA3122]|uniref:ribokinase n=1 Tax=Halalkalibaculum sp. DA3122 TaxID=3373607 RepID=UPI00375402F5
MEENIVVIGSANVDMVVKTDEFPKPGETIIGGRFFKFAGGKGANQAVSAARLGGNVTFICKVGDDDLGRSSIENYKEEGINTDNILIDNEEPTGVALITVNKKGENKIVVAPGANSTLTVNEIEQLSDLISSASVIVLQLEIPLEIIGQVLTIAKQNDTRVILNPAPAQKLPNSYYKGLYLITPNETEVEQLTGVRITDQSTANEAANKFRDMGIQNVVITLGEKGAFLSAGEYSEFVSAPQVNVKDTTAAGDVFNGALAVALTEKRSWKEAIVFACKAAALSVTKNGAQSSVPTVTEIETLTNGQIDDR